MEGTTRSQWLGFGLLAVTAVALLAGAFAAVLAIASQSCGC
jgi:hypothetical protein